MATATHPSRNPLEPDALRDILDAHAQWLASDGERGERANLAGAALAEADLSGINLSRAVLTGADLAGADLTHTILDHALMARAVLHGAELMGASLVGADLTWADLSEADLTGADLSSAMLPDAELTGARLVRSNFTGAGLDGADLTGADIEGMVMVGADMSGARFADGTHDEALDAAFEADQVWDAPELTPVSELPDADEEDEPEPEAAVAAAPTSTPTATPEPPAHAAPVPGGPADRLAQVADRLAAHAEWLASGGARGARADLSDLSPLPARALAGADLSHATVPIGPVMGAAARARALASGVNRVLGVTVAACIYAILALTPATMMPGIPVRLPLFGGMAHPIVVALAMPLGLLLCHLWLHGAVQRLADGCAHLPRRLPDGTTPLPPDWHLPHPDAERVPILSGIHWLARGLAFGAVPCTLALFAGAFAGHVTTAGTVTQAFLTAAAAGVSVFSLVRLRRCD